MQLPVEAAKATGTPDVITVWDASAIRRQRGNPYWPVIGQAIDELGRGSKAAQGLNNVLTSVERLLDHPDHRLYLLMKDRSAIGILKVGPKKLFIRTKSAALREIEPLCVLDFYVSETAQRSGYGRALFDRMLTTENVTPPRLGYDRPSVKFLAFLRKHFGLVDYVPQTNNFVVFDAYFSGTAEQYGPLPAVAPTPLARAAPQSKFASRNTPNSYQPPQPAATMGGRAPRINSLGETISMAGGAEHPFSLANLAATLPAKSGSVAAHRRSHSPTTRSSMNYNIITLEGADGCSPHVGKTLSPNVHR